MEIYSYPQLDEQIQATGSAEWPAHLLRSARRQRKDLCDAGGGFWLD